MNVCMTRVTTCKSHLLFLLIVVFVASRVDAAEGKVHVDPSLGVPDVATIDWPDGEPPTKVQVNLGRTLFFDQRLSQNQVQSCATCHNPDLGVCRR